MGLRKASRKNKLLRMAIYAPSGGGKTFTALRCIFALFPDAKVCVIDTENDSASMYEGMAPDGTAWEFDIYTIDDYSPQVYVDTLTEIAPMKYDFVIIDSLSHAWAGAGGALELKDSIAEADGKNNTFAAWRHITPMHNRLVEALISFPGHVIATMRAKVSHQMVTDENGKTTVKKIGVVPVQREGIEYEFDIVCDMDTENILTVGKTRIPTVSGLSVTKPGKPFFEKIFSFLRKDPNASFDYSNCFMSKDDFVKKMLKDDTTSKQRLRQQKIESNQLEQLANKAVENGVSSDEYAQIYLDIEKDPRAAVKKLIDEVGQDAVRDRAKKMHIKPEDINKDSAFKLIASFQ